MGHRVAKDIDGVEDRVKLVTLYLPHLRGLFSGLQQPETLEDLLVLLHLPKEVEYLLIVHYHLGRKDCLQRLNSLE